jgi:hypothetical protein
MSTKATFLISGGPVSPWPHAVLAAQPLFAIVLQFSGEKDNAYNILWALVFGFATLNILSLVARRFEPTRNRLNLGEILAVLVVIVSVLLLGTEMLHIFKIFPIKLEPR